MKTSTINIYYLSKFTSTIFTYSFNSRNDREIIFHLSISRKSWNAGIFSSISCLRIQKQFIISSFHHTWNRTIDKFFFVCINSTKILIFYLLITITIDITYFEKVYIFCISNTISCIKIYNTSWNLTSRRVEPMLRCMIYYNIRLKFKKNTFMRRNLVRKIT